MVFHKAQFYVTFKIWYKLNYERSSYSISIEKYEKTKKCILYYQKSLLSILHNQFNNMPYILFLFFIPYIIYFLSIPTATSELKHHHRYGHNPKPNTIHPRPSNYPSQNQWPLTTWKKKKKKIIEIRLIIPIFVSLSYLYPYLYLWIRLIIYTFFFN